jgi:hypothetical protein
VWEKVRGVPSVCAEEKHETAIDHVPVRPRQVVERSAES